MQAGNICPLRVVALFLSIAVSAPASAADIVSSFEANGSLPAVQMSRNNTYDFTFTTSPSLPINSVVTLSMISDVIVVNNQGKSESEPQKLQYQLYWGDPGSGMFLAQSLSTTDPLISFNPIPGQLYVEISPDQIARDGETVSGSLTTTLSAVPEPATWAMMSLGFGALGGVARRRRRRSAVPA